MSRFTQEQEPLGRFVGKETYRLEEEMFYEIGKEGSGYAIVVPKGFETDFASIPRFFQRLLPKLDKHRRAAILHDYLYSLNGKFSLHAGEFQSERKWDRKACDEIFLEAMKVLGVPMWKRQSMYLAVRSGGWVAWNGHAKRIAKEIAAA